MTASARQRSKGVPHLPKPVAGLQSRDHKPATVAVASGPACSGSEEFRTVWGRRPQRPGNQLHLRAFLDVPRQFTLANHRLPLARPQSFGELRNSHVFAEPTLFHNVAPRNTKTFPRCEQPVDDVTSLWKTEEN